MMSTFDGDSHSPPGFTWRAYGLYAQLTEGAPEFSLARVSLGFGRPAAVAVVHGPEGDEKFNLVNDEDILRKVEQLVAEAWL